MTDPVALSREYLRAVRRDGDPAGPRADLAALDPGTLEAALEGQADRLAFWLNVYNAAVQDLLSRDPSLLDSKWRFFGAERLTVAGEALSLNDVEHGLLRRSRPLLGGGYVRNPFPGAFERRFRVEELDPRIHFALNCGAASCPMVVGYGADDVDELLDERARDYLEGRVEYEPGGLVYDGTLHLPRIFLWYRGDFGGKRGILRFLDRYGLVPGDVRPRLSHQSYDWSLKLGHFADEAEG